MRLRQIALVARDLEWEDVGIDATRLGPALQCLSQVCYRPLPVHAG